MRPSRAWRLAVPLVIAALTAPHAGAQTPQATKFVWRRADIAGGGMNTGLLFHPAAPGLVYARQDVSGLLRWDARADRWVQLLDWMPAAWVNAKGCDGLAVDTTAGADRARQDVVYAALGQYSNQIQGSPEANGVWRSRDRGDTWTKIWDGVRRVEGPGYHEQGWSFGSNLNVRMDGEPLAVDPFNPNLLYAATHNAGVWRSFNARAPRPDWEKIRGGPEGFIQHVYAPTGVRVVLLDPRGGRVDADTPRERARIIFLGVPQAEADALKNSDAPPDVKSGAAFGVYRSRDGGETWEHLAGPGAPANVSRLALSTPAGSILAAGDAKGLRRFDGRAWSLVPGTDAVGFQAVATHPQHHEWVAASVPSAGQLWRSHNGGRTWLKSGMQGGDTAGAVNWAVPGFMNPGGANDVAFDPHRPGAVWFGDAFGIHATPDVWKPALRWTPHLHGYETTVTWALGSPAAGPQLYSLCADVNGFLWDDVGRTPTRQLWQTVFPNDRGGGPGQENWGVGDAALSHVAFAPSDPSLHVLARSTWKGYTAPYARLYRSHDAGRTWQSFPAPPPAPDAPGYAQAGGMAKLAISATDPNRWVYVRPFAAPYFTTNGLGAKIEWKPSQGVPFSAKDVFPYGVNLIRLAADAVDGKRFYLTNHAGGAVEVWRSVDGGATWSLPPGARLPDADAFLLAPVRDGTRGELWVSLKERGLWRSADGGETYVRVREGVIKAAYGVAWGRAAPGSGAPTLYVAGTLAENGRDVDGVFLSTDRGRTFTRMTPAGRPFFGGLPLNDMAGDPRLFGRVYLGTGGTGVLYSTARPDRTPGRHG